MGTWKWLKLWKEMPKEPDKLTTMNSLRKLMNNLDMSKDKFLISMPLSLLLAIELLLPKIEIEMLHKPWLISRSDLKIEVLNVDKKLLFGNNSTKICLQNFPLLVNSCIF